MKEIVTIVKRHGSRQWEVLISPDEQRRTHRQAVRDVRARREHSEFEWVYVAQIVRRIRLKRAKVKTKEAPKPTLFQRAINTVFPPAQDAKNEAPKKPARTAKAKPQTQLAARLAAQPKPAAAP
jgi:hypothetical protein